MKKMAIHFSPLVYLITLGFSIYTASPALVFNLVHPNSLKPSHVSKIEETSVASRKYVQAKASAGDIIANLSLNTQTAFLVNISIGSPPVMQLLHMDTGSSLTWLQCRPCANCYPQSLPIFDPSRSSSYHTEFCKSYKNSEESFTCNPITGYSEYSKAYVGGTGSKGTLAQEIQTFSTIYDESSSASLQNVVFGCGHNNYGIPVQGNGVLGLGYGESSLVHRLGSKFSYCLGNLDDPSYLYNVLVMGDTGANMLGDTTSLETEHGLYYVSLESISLGGINLEIDPWVFEREYDTPLSGTIMDTGTTLTMLVREAYEPLEKKIEDIFQGRFEIVHVQHRNYKRECFKGDFERDLIGSGFPMLTFHFTDGAELSLDVKSLFSKTIRDTFCLTVAQTIGSNVNVIGATAQQNYNVGYDLEAKEISFESIDCGVIFEKVINT